MRQLRRDTVRVHRRHGPLACVETGGGERTGRTGQAQVRSGRMEGRTEYSEVSRGRPRLTSGPRCWIRFDGKNKLEGLFEVRSKRGS
jgi:hypothetical protein